MKKVIRITFILFCFFLQTGLFANTVIVKGYVKDSANHAVANKSVKIYSTDSVNNGCVLSHTVVTNPNGYYIDTLTCNGDIRKLVIIVESCNGLKITHTQTAVSTPNIVESNFTICEAVTTIPLTCKAAFSYTSSATGVKFNGAGSSTIAGDTIISRTWIFGDSTASVTGNIVDPTHTYKKPGVYNACLTIKTKRGCESSYCQTVVLTPAATVCNVQAMISFEKTAPKVYRFNSSQSSTGTGDSIVQRTWKFGDGSSLDGNQVNPLKQYKDTGVYSVCISVRTAKGCEKQYCINVVVRDTVPGTIPVQTNCKAQFSYSIKDSIIRFNSADSRPSSIPGDSIISRTWYYSDSTHNLSLTGNVIDTSISIKNIPPGSYRVYLVIKTKLGCESKFVLSVVIPKPVLPTNCKAAFTYSIKDSTIRFNSADSKASSTSGDSIISRTWYFIDSTHNLSLAGNVVDTFISINNIKPGTYNVYLVIKTKLGCESRFTLAVTIPRQVVPTNCKAVFTYTLKDSTVRFNSADSKPSTVAGDSIISRTWYYSDSTHNLTLAGNVIDTSIVYNKPGTYHVYLVIKTKLGCESKYTLAVVIPKPVIPTSCKAIFTYTLKDSTVRFNSADSKPSTVAGDSIISRTWYYSDSTHNLTLAGNVIDTSIVYNKPGTYHVYLVIKTKLGCESKYTLAVVIPQAPVPATCKALFTFVIQNRSVKFNSAGSKAGSSSDSIVGRYWIFGDSSTVQQAVTIDPLHEYAKSGKYTVTLYIKTKSGCESKYTETIVIPVVNCPVDVQFGAERMSLKKIQFNSSLSKAQAGDSIIQRNWKFGDNTVLSGNEISPIKEFPLLGVYNTCLQVRTLNGCEAQACKQVVVQDTMNAPQSSVDYIKIISINPNPVITRMMNTVFSRNNNVEAEINIYDIYGTRKLTVKKILSQGNNIIEINTEFLYHGP
jgi:PKD repeat protein